MLDPMQVIMESTNKAYMNIITYNCRGFNKHKSSYVAKLLSTCDILYLQEHWLADDQICTLANVCSSHNAIGVCGFDKTVVLRGRPYGGCAIFYRRSDACSVKIINTESNRVCAIRLWCDDYDLLFVNVYMPCESDDNSFRTFCSVLSTINSVCESFPDAMLILGGDFNVDFSRDTLHTDELQCFCTDLNLSVACNHPMSNVDFTYHFNMERFSIIDHFMVPNYVFASHVKVVTSVHDVDNLSDHEPVYMQLGLSFRSCIHTLPKNTRTKPAWYKADRTNIAEYKSDLQSRLLNVTVPTSVLSCHDVKCCIEEHASLLKQYVSDIIRICIEAANSTMPKTDRNVSLFRHRTPGWEEHVAPARHESIFWHNMWVECGRPRSGVVADCMRRTRSAYHYAIRYIRRNEKVITREKFAKSIVDNCHRDFWSEVRKIKGCDRSVSGIVDGMTGNDDIANTFADKYDNLYTSVPYNKEDMQHIVEHIDNDIDEFTEDCIISFKDVVDAILTFKSNKNDGHLGLSTDHLINACDELYIHLSMFFSAMIVHGIVFEDLLISSVIPIPKGKNINTANSENYRGIALSSILGKCLDRIILNRYVDKLMTSPYQFGFKRHHSTTMCTMVLKETVYYYTTNKSRVFCTLLDATKAFDRVKYCKLFQCLVDRNLPAVVLRVLYRLYTNQVMCVKWNGGQSRWFHSINGVKQGGVLSPILFCIYLDGLLKTLSSARMGCFVGTMFTGILAYADDIALLAPTPQAMRCMLLTCEKYAAEYGVLFNASKSKCIICTAPSSKVAPDFASYCKFKISGNEIEFVQSWAHLGHIVSSTMDDEKDIDRSRHNLISKLNEVLSTFRDLDSFVKVRLLKNYCLSLYGCELWNLRHASVENICKSWRSALKSAWGLPSMCRTSVLEIVADVVPLYDVICLRALSFIKRCLSSDSDVVRYVTSYGLQYGRMSSIHGKNIQVCCERYLRNQNDLLGGTFDKRHVRAICLNRRDTESYCRAACVLELLMVKRDILYIPDNFLSNGSKDINDMLYNLCISWC